MDRSEWVLVPKEVRDLYQFMVAAFSPFTSQQEQIAISLKKAKDAMLAAAPPPPAEQASGEWRNFRGETFEEARAQIVHVLKAQKSWVTGYAEAYVDEFAEALSQRPVVVNIEKLTGDDMGCISTPAVAGASAVKWDHVETERRKAAFNAWVRTQANKQGFRLMPPGYQGIVHGMLRLAFYAGSNWQRRHGAKAPQQPTGEEG